MNYLLLNHVPFGRGKSDGSFTVGDMWLEDIRAQARAVRGVGMKLVVATPLIDELDLNTSGSFNHLEIRPEDYGFDFAPIPFYISLKQFMSVKNELIARLAEVIKTSDIVHLGYGGHPVAMGQVAWPIAGKMNRKRIWIFDGADPFPRLELHASEEKNPIKRLAKKLSVLKFKRFCRGAVRDADLVFAHNAAVVERFADVWDPKRCYSFDRSYVTDATLLSNFEIEHRKRYLLDITQPLRLVVAGRQIMIKGTDHVLRAMRTAINRGARLELDVMGDGDDLLKFKSLSRDLKLDNVVRFTGTVPYGRPLFEAWAKAHVMVITNLTAEISRNVLLAMARGLPLIMYSNPGSDELLRTSGAGAVVPRGDEAALATALEHAAANRAELADQAVKGVAAAAKNTLDATHRRRAEIAASLFSPSRAPAGVSGAAAIIR